MCVVSMVGDHFNDKWKDPSYPLYPQIQKTITTDSINLNEYLRGSVTRTEFDALKKEVEEMKKLLERALEYDKKNNEPHCEMEDKVALLKKVAEAVGVNLDEIFK